MRQAYEIIEHNYDVVIVGTGDASPNPMYFYFML
jgi:hypothetical protein